MLYNREAQPGSADLTRARLIHTVESLEHSRHIRGGYAWTGIRYDDSRHAFGLGLHTDVDDEAFAIEVHGVGKDLKKACSSLRRDPCTTASTRAERWMRTFFLRWRRAYLRRR